MPATKNYCGTTGTVKLYLFLSVQTVMIAMVVVMVVKLNLCYDSYFENFIDLSFANSI